MFGQIRRPRSECTIPMYCKFSLPTPQIYRTLVCALHCGGKVLEICAVLVKYDRQNGGYAAKNRCASLVKN